MSQSNLGVRITADVSQIKSQFDALGQAARDVNERIKELTEAKDYGALKDLSISMNNITAARATLWNQENQQVRQENMAKMQSQNKYKTQAMAYMAPVLAQQAAQTAVNAIVNGYNTSVSGARMAASGDPVGGNIEMVRGLGQIKGSLLGGGIGTGMGLASRAIPYVGPALSTVLTPLLGGLGSSLGGAAGGMEGDRMSITHALVQQYTKALPDIDAFYQRFGQEIDKQTASVNSDRGIDFLAKATQMARDTGLTTGQLMSAANRVGEFGVSGADEALSKARNHALWSRFTGADLGAVQRLGGTALRYGGEQDAVGTAYAGLMYQNMAKAQFGEFLSSMQRILEDGIEKGFVRGSEEIAGNMALLYKLSGGNPLWQGEQGAKRMGQMSQGIEASTSLETSGHMINYTAAKMFYEDPEKKDMINRFFGPSTGRVRTNTDVDIMQILEGGFHPELFRRQSGLVSGIYKGDDGAQIRQYMQMYDMNFTGAAHVWGMAKELEKNPGKYTDAEIQGELDSMRAKPEYWSDSSNLQNALNKMSLQLAEMGRTYFAEEIRIIGGMSVNLQNLVNNFLGGNKTRTVNSEDMIKKAENNQLGQGLPTPKTENILKRSDGKQAGINGIGMRDPNADDDYQANYYPFYLGIMGKGDYSKYEEFKKYQEVRSDVMRDGKVTADELLNGLLPALRALAEATGNLNNFNGRTDEKIIIQLTTPLLNSIPY